MFKSYVLALHERYGWRVLPAQDLLQLRRTNDSLLLLALIENNQDEITFHAWRPRMSWLTQKAARLGFGHFT